MSDFPAFDEATLPLFIHTWMSPYSACAPWAGGVNTSIASPSANLAKYMPIYLPFTYPVRRVFWINGSSVTSVNADFGIYSADGTCLYSTGSVVCSGASALQYTTASPTLVLPGGWYYFAKVVSSSTSNRGGWGATALARQIDYERLGGILQQASALPLPANMTGVAVANAIFPICGITRTASGF